MNKYKGIAVFIFLFSVSPQTSGAKESENQGIAINLANTRTSDDLSLDESNFGFRRHRRDLFFPYANEAEKATDVGLELNFFAGQLGPEKFTSMRAMGLTARKLSKNLLVEAGLGGQTFSSDQTKSTLFIPGASVYYQVPQKLMLQAVFDRFYLAQSGYIPGPIRDGTSAWRLKSAATYFVSEKVRLLLRPEVDLISDSNQRFYSDFAAMYGVSTWPSWIWFGAGGEYLTHTKAEPYWSPSVFKSYGLRFEMNTPITEQFSGLFGLNLNQIQEQDYAWGSGHYLNAGIMYGDRNRSNLKVTYTNIQSVQSTSRWISNSFSINWNYFF